MSSLHFVLLFGVLLLFACENDLRPTEDAAGEQAVSVTRWTEKTELFVEFPPFVVGRETAFAAHLTDLATFKPVAEGTLKVSLTSPQGQAVVAEARMPTVPGIYRPTIIANTPGIYRLKFHRYNPGDNQPYDILDAGDVKVSAKIELSQQTDDKAAAAAITFLKEQQWRMDFATEPVRERELSAEIKLSAEVKPAAGGQAQVIAPVGGQIVTVNGKVPAPGDKVKQGQHLAYVIPLPNKHSSDLTAELATAKAELEAAESELKRVQELYRDKIVPRRRLEQAEKEVAVQKARSTAAQTQLHTLHAGGYSGPGGLPLRSPISGTIVSVALTPGSSVEAGQSLIWIVDLGRLWIEGRLFETDIAKVQRLDRARFTAAGLAEPLDLAPSKLRLVNISSVIDPATRSVPVLVEVRNMAGQLRLGLRGDLAIATGEKITALVIPLSAIIDDKGVPVAFVHAEGETFERRELALGIRSEGYAQVTSGLTAGERVVTKGAYRVHLASLSTSLPAHGHAH